MSEGKVSYYFDPDQEYEVQSIGTFWIRLKHQMLCAY